MTLPDALPRTAPYEMVFGEIHEFFGMADCPSRCYLRLYKSVETSPDTLHSELAHPPVAIATYWMEKPGTSITNAVEILASEAWRRLGCPPDMVWIENYEPESWKRKYGRVPTKNEFDRVTFGTIPCSGDACPRFVDPQWRPMPRADIERVLGQPVLAVNP